jgi:hypothetical protein
MARVRRVVLSSAGEPALQKITLNKTITARKLSKTGVPTSDPEATIPFGAILDRVERDGDWAAFRYLTESYRCAYDVLASAVDGEPLVAGRKEPQRAEPAAATVSAPAIAELHFENVKCNVGAARRAKVPGGWLVWMEPAALAFYPDSEHRW